MINQPQTAVPVTYSPPQVVAVPVVFAYPVLRPDPPAVVAATPAQAAPRNEEQVDICSAVACALVIFLILAIFFPSFFVLRGRQQQPIDGG